ncbi:MAG: 8-oxo-dGTP diphosphatase [Verrucomicrobiae bacterium]|nr:8-oxo-dGTP diphosphatase [Verrucomicrobiae bacterium]MCP5549649.1 8-oxo-dGTP diphosphatase [Akkermansiaceae bacterium]
MRANLVFVTRGERVLLIHKKRGLGAGKINGPGGKIEPGETAVGAAVREVEEELCIAVRDATEAGVLRFAFRDGLHLHCTVFRATEYDGEPSETDEATPEWFAFGEIPYDRMWEDDIHWLPGMLEGRDFDAWFEFDGEAMLSKRVEWR